VEGDTLSPHPHSRRLWRLEPRTFGAPYPSQNLNAPLN